MFTLLTQIFIKLSLTLPVFESIIHAEDEYHYIQRRKTAVLTVKQRSAEKERYGINMICGKCGKDVDDGSKFCPFCGHTFSGRVIAAKVLKAIVAILFFAIFMAIVFMFGNYFGKTEVGKQVETPDIVAVISEKIKDMTYLPLDLEFTQDELNSMIKKNENNLLPLKDMKLTFPSEGGVTLSAVIAKEDISKVFGANIPDVLIMFLPEQVTVFAQADPTVENGTLKAGIKSITVGGITLGSETLSHFGADELVSDIVSSLISAEYGQKVEITKLSVGPSKNGEPVLNIGINYYIAK